MNSPNLQQLRILLNHGLDLYDTANKNVLEHIAEKEYFTKDDLNKTIFHLMNEHMDSVKEVRLFRAKYGEKLNKLTGEIEKYEVD